MDTASIEVAPEADLVAIATAAGAGAMADRFYADGRLYVRGVTQAALDAALETVMNAEPVLPPPPSEVTNFQARALMRSIIMADGRSMETTVREGLLASKAAVEAIPESDPARIAADTAWLAWEQANVFVRSGTLVATLGAQLGLTDEQIDNLFRQAAVIEA